MVPKISGVNYERRGWTTMRVGENEQEMKRLWTRNGIHLVKN